ncbi:MAG: acylphosphatase [Kofleriaceae bacterium]|nr:acylphosphatase [Myxococcales bacterium]MCB9560918.1 acylphosphatase [Kofleriaceae bacterium]
MRQRRVRIVVRGVVQGVSYRASTRVTAAELGVVGWVRNRADGAVELEAQGDDAQLAALQAWCAHGPPLAEVTGVAVDGVAVVDGERGFTIRY